jgi:hypothetical protein
VKADHDYQKQKELVSNQKARADYNARMLAKAPTTTTYAQDQEQELVLEAQKEEQLEDDDLKYYREKRLRELKQMANNNHYIRQQQKVFGTLNTVEADDYPNEIDDEWKTIPVIVHLYDEVPEITRLIFFFFHFDLRALLWIELASVQEYGQLSLSIITKICISQIHSSIS